jgi:hypothetical protein
MDEKKSREMQKEGKATKAIGKCFEAAALF